MVRDGQFGEEPSTAVARALLKVGFSTADQERMRELAAKARAGTLSAEEERLCSTYEQLGCALDVLHSKARRALKRPREGS
jgi:hypothetical protein